MGTQKRGYNMFMYADGYSANTNWGCRACRRVTGNHNLWSVYRVVQDAAVREFDYTRTCPSGYHGLTKSECANYANTTKGRTWRYSGSWSDHPVGCYSQPSNGKVWYNQHPTGAARRYH